MDEDEERREAIRKAKWAKATQALIRYLNTPTDNVVTIAGPAWDYDFATGPWIDAIAEADPYWRLDGDLPDPSALIALLRNPAVKLAGASAAHLRDLIQRHQFKAKFAPRNAMNVARAKAAHVEAVEICSGSSVSSNEREVLAGHFETYIIAKRSQGSSVPSYERTSPNEARHIEAIDTYKALRGLRNGVRRGQKVAFEGQSVDLHSQESVVRAASNSEGLAANSLQSRIDGKHGSSRRLNAGLRGRGNKPRTES